MNVTTECMCVITLVYGYVHMDEGTYVYVYIRVSVRVYMCVCVGETCVCVLLCVTQRCLGLRVSRVLRLHCLWGCTVTVPCEVCTYSTCILSQRLHVDDLILRQHQVNSGQLRFS